MKKPLALLLCTALILGLAAGCATTPSADTTTAAGTAATQVGQTTAPASTTPETPVKAALTVALGAKYPTLDPNYYPTDISRLVMEDLVTMNYTTSEIVPTLAESWAISEDGMTWTLKLRQGVTFHDGSPFTADDVLYSVEHAKEGPNAYAYEGVTFEAKGDFEVAIVFPEYTNLLQYDVSIPILCAEKHKALGDTEYFEQLIGTGPYSVESYDSATGVTVLKRNDSYWGETGKMETITFRVISDQSATLIALENGEVDFAMIDSTVYNTASRSQTLDVAFGPAILAYTLCFNTKVYPASEKAFRQAVSYAVDRELVASVSEVEGNYEIADAFYATVWGDRPSGLTSYNYDPDKAVALLDDMGLQRPYDLGTLSILPAHKNMVEALQQNLSEIGLTFKIEMLESVAHRDLLRSDNFIIGITAGTDINVAPVYTFYSYFNHNMNPFNKYQSDTTDALADKVYLSVNQQEVSASMEELMRIASEEALYSILFLNGRIFAHATGLVTDMSDSRNRHFENFAWN